MAVQTANVIHSAKSLTTLHSVLELKSCQVFQALVFTSNGRAKHSLNFSNCTSALTLKQTKYIFIYYEGQIFSGAKLINRLRFLLLYNNMNMTILMNMYSHVQYIKTLSPSFLHGFLYFAIVYLWMLLSLGLKNLVRGSSTDPYFDRFYCGKSTTECLNGWIDDDNYMYIADNCIYFTK